MLNPTMRTEGTWQLSVRDIDPSAVATGAPHHQGKTKESCLWRGHEVAIAPTDDMSHEEWLSDDSEVLQLGCEQLLRFTNPKDRSGTYISN